MSLGMIFLYCVLGYFYGLALKLIVSDTEKGDH